MMSRRRIFALVAGVAITGTACMAYPSSSWFQSQSLASGATPVSGDAESSPTVMQAGGYQREEGPRVSIYADIDNSAGTRLVRANFHLDDDAYVVVGHIDADGILKIEFPDTPSDLGFTQGRASYQTAQFVAGFTDQYRARFSTGYRSPANTYDSYDGGTGYVFIIASWQPMHFEKFSTDGRWDSFELTDADYVRNPRPAVYELASLLAGTNPSTYTVKFASAYDTRMPYAASSAFYSADNAFGAQMCSGFGYGYTFGFPSSPFSSSAYNPILTYGYGQPFWWRGTQYEYDPGFDCYHAAGFNSLGFGYFPVYRYGWSIAQTPPPPLPPTNGRLIGIDRIRPPVTPQAPAVHVFPGTASDVGNGNTNASKLTLAPENQPEYRTRGLVVHQDPTVPGEVVPQRSFNGRGRDAGTQGSGFQGLVIRGGNDTRTQATNNDNASAHRAPSTRSDANPSSPRVQSQSHSNDAPRPAPRAEAPRSTPPPAPHVEAARSEPARSAPAASSSSSSGGKPPGSKN